MQLLGFPGSALSVPNLGVPVRSEAGGDALVWSLRSSPAAG